MQIIKKHICLMLFILAFSVQAACLEDDVSGEKGSGTLKVTVITSTDIWNYPLYDGTYYRAYSGDTGSESYWHYAATGGDGDPADEENLSQADITSTEEGDRINVVYLYSTLGDYSSEYPVIRNGSSSIRDGEITITGIIPGTYYVVAFYDYCGGGNQTNILNRYDRYSIYTETLPLDSTANSTVYYDNATAVEISENETVTMELEIKRDWVLGKPKTSISTNAGRKFLHSGELPPVP